MPSNKTGNKLCFYQAAADNEGHNCGLWLQLIIGALRHREQPVSNVECNFLAAARWSFKSILKTLVSSPFMWCVALCGAFPPVHLLCGSSLSSAGRDHRDAPVLSEKREKPLEGKCVI